MMLAPVVAMLRLPVMADETQGGFQIGAETMRAVTEKASAMTEGVIEAQLSLMHSAMRFWPEVLSGTTPSLLTGVALERSLHAALAPSGRRVKANFRRLSRRR